MRLDEVHLVRLKPRVGERLAQHGFLRRAVGRGEAVAAAVLVRGRAADQRRRCGRRPPARRDSRFSTSMPQPSPRTNPSARASNALQRPSGAIMCDFDSAMVIVRAEDEVHAAGQRQVALAAAQAVHRVVDRHERRGARRVDRHARARAVPRKYDSRPEAMLCATPEAV